MNPPLTAARLLELSGEIIPDRHLDIVTRKVEEALISYFEGLGLWSLRTRANDAPDRFDFDTAYLWLDSTGSRLIRRWVIELEAAAS